MIQLLKRTLLEPIRIGVTGALLPIERRLLRKAGGIGVPPIFIVGPPRSGTTLVYEALISGYGFSYLSNLAHRFPKTPAAATQLGLRWIRRHEGKFESRFGHISGWGAPNEGGAIWNRWFPREIYLEGDYVRRVPLEEVQGTIGAIAKIMGGPFLNKNVMHSVHLELLDRLFPGCVFIEIRRAPKPNIRSIARMRLSEAEANREGRIEWDGVKPRAWKNYEDEDFVMKACAQVFHVWEDIGWGVEKIGSDRFFRIEYETFCRTPASVITDLVRFWSDHGIEVPTKGRIPESFPVSEGKPLDPENEKRIDRGIEILWGRPSDSKVWV